MAHPTQPLAHANHPPMQHQGPFRTPVAPEGDPKFDHPLRYRVQPVLPVRQFLREGHSFHLRPQSVQHAHQIHAIAFRRALARRRSTRCQHVAQFLLRSPMTTVRLQNHHLLFLRRHGFAQRLHGLWPPLPLTFLRSCGCHLTGVAQTRGAQPNGQRLRFFGPIQLRKLATFAQRHAHLLRLLPDGPRAPHRLW